MQDLDIDPYTIENWEQYAQDCIACSETWRLRKMLADFIWMENRAAKSEIQAYCNRRQGDWMKEDLDEVIKRKKPRALNVNRRLM